MSALVRPLAGVSTVYSRSENGVEQSRDVRAAFRACLTGWELWVYGGVSDLFMQKCIKLCYIKVCGSMEGFQAALLFRGNTEKPLRCYS